MQSDLELTESAVDAPADPALIMRIACGFMAAKHLFAANELGIFRALADSPASLDALAARTGLTRRAARISVDAMVALGLVERDGGSYKNGPAAAKFLSGRAGLTPFLRFWDRISYPIWTRLADALARGPSEQIFDVDAETQEIISAGIEAILAGPAAALAQTCDFSRHRRLLDVGGGTGSWSVAVVQRHPHMSATVYELPQVAEIARKRVAEAKLAARIGVVAGDAMTGSLPGGHDVFLLANIAHYGSPEENRALLARTRDTASAGSRLLAADFWTDAAHTEPVEAALMAGEFAVHLKNGDVYSVDEVREWLGATGWRFLEHRPLAGPVSLVVAEAW